jgi:hypothetical protein
MAREPLRHRIAITRIGEGNQLDLRPIVPFKEWFDEEGHRVRSQVW